MPDPQSLTIRMPDDFHVHLRQDRMLLEVIVQTARQFRRSLIMPNTTPPVRTARDVERYRKEILDACARVGCTEFEPLMTIALTDETTPEDIRAARAAGAIAAKLYPRGVTTNSDHGVRHPLTLDTVYAAMADVGMVLCVHGESCDPIATVMDAEERFLDTFEAIVRGVEGLRIVFEHVSSSAALERIWGMPSGRVAATITVHHLVLTIADVVGARVQPHHFCKPIAKTSSDREFLIEAATSGNPRFFLGTDSAPHPRSAKESASVPAGCFTAPVALPLLATVFEQANALDRLEDFTSTFGAHFYGLPRNECTITLTRRPFRVSASVGGVVPFRAGDTLPWTLPPFFRETPGGEPCTEQSG